MSYNFATYSNLHNPELEIGTYSEIESFGPYSYKGDSATGYSGADLNRSGYCTLQGDHADCTQSIEYDSETLMYCLTMEVYFLGDDSTKTSFFKFRSSNPIKVKIIHSGKLDKIKLYTENEFGN